MRHGRRFRLVVLAAALALGAGATTRAEFQARLKAGADLVARNAFNEALQTLEPLAADPMADDPAFAGDLQYYIGQAYYRLAKYPQADEHWQRAIVGSRRAHDGAGEARALRAVAQMRKNQGRYAEGIELGTAAVGIYESLGDARNAALGWIVLGAIHDLVGEHQLALESYEHALPALAGQKSANAGTLLYEMGISYKNLGRYSDALRCYTQALEIYAQLNDAGNRAVVLGNLGVLYGTIGDDERAIAYNNQALALSREQGDLRFEVIGLLNVADSYWRLGRHDKAMEALQQELTLAEEIGARTEIALAHKNLGDIHAIDGQLAKAHAEYDQALRLQEEMHELRTQGSTLIALSDLARREHRTDDALAFAQKALAIARDTARPELEWDARRSVAAAETALGRTADAIEQLRASATIINDLRASMTADASKIAFMDQRQDVFADLALLLVGAGRVDEGLEVAEAARARAFADLLEERQMLGKPANRAALIAVRRAAIELRTAAAGPAHHPAPDDRAVDPLSASLAALDESDHELASLVTAKSPTAADLASTARRLNATLVEYLSTADALLAWVVDPSGHIHAARTGVPRTQLEALTRSVRDATESTVKRTASPHRALRRLDDVLIAPIAHWLPRDPDAVVTIVPNGALALLPFAALEDAAGRPLLERHVLSFTPAASVFAYTRAKRRSTTAPRQSLVIADPNPPAGSGIASLPGARDEGERIARRLGPNTRLLAGAAATEAVVKRDAARYGVIHFATHGLIVSNRPLASSLVLAEGDGDDGYLRVDEIFNLDLSAELVVLSGCSTGLGRLSGDGVIGMTRALLYAGTPTVVVSQWNVSDRTTASLMDTFYAALNDGRGPARALRAAALATRRSHPALSAWAAFEVVGEPR